MLVHAEHSVQMELIPLQGNAMPVTHLVKHVQVKTSAIVVIIHLFYLQTDVYQIVKMELSMEMVAVVHVILVVSLVQDILHLVLAALLLLSYIITHAILFALWQQSMEHAQLFALQEAI